MPQRPLATGAAPDNIGEVVHPGSEFRVAREARGDQIDSVSAATGIAPNAIRAIEAGDTNELPPPEITAELVRRYATYLGIDPNVWSDADNVNGDDDDTQEIPVVSRTRRADSNLLWIGGGALAGLVGLVIFGGGIGGGDDGPSPPSPASKAAPVARPAAPKPQPKPTPAPPAEADPPSETLRPTSPANTMVRLTLDAQKGKTVWMEVRADDVRGKQLFAGAVGGGVTRTIEAPDSLYLSVAWVPNARISLNGEIVDADGGTEAYTVTESGLKRLTGSG